MAYSPENRPVPEAPHLLPDGAAAHADHAPPLPDELARTLAGLGPAGAAPAPRGASGTRSRPLALGLVGTVLLLALVFLVQNTGGVEIGFLWAQGRIPLAVALLAAGMAGAAISRAVAAARVTPRRRRR
ncbi:DUF1049 domain-containing protein [Couchioplanes azureus]|uniref:DUF1049 domain-containing protein n=1 Tax=Couchioplanes caeruleus TaxID=56438 RepID=UPI00167167C1|nr:DUF1049 domain-containing protein [Couchioplanes caeruleus]GGQ78431.1 hypothetical protein GCM10010166_55760 [Couchioplanes caeruleus subsp. azureus]